MMWPTAIVPLLITVPDRTRHIRPSDAEDCLRASDQAYLTTYRRLREIRSNSDPQYGAISGEPPPT